jgi:hypothetical protein
MQRHERPREAPLLPLSRATVQLWGFEQTRRSTGEREPRRPLRSLARWIATALRH